MAQPAQVTSIEAVDAFKSSLVLYVAKAGRLLDEVSETVVRTRIWLETDRLVHWKSQVRLRTREVAQADQELLTARLSGMPEAIKARRMAADKARQSLHQAEEGLDRVRQWIRRYETQVESQSKLVSQLRQTLAVDMTRAVSFLEGAVTTLASYADLAPHAPSTQSNLEPNPAGPDTIQPARPAGDIEAGLPAASPDGSPASASGSNPPGGKQDAPSDSDPCVPGEIHTAGAEDERSVSSAAQRKGPL